MKKLFLDLISNKSNRSSNRFIFVFVIVNCIIMIWYEIICGRIITWEFITLITSLMSIVTGGKVTQKFAEKKNEEAETNNVEKIE